MERQSGILLHISSLHSKYGIGSLGKAAYEFVDYLKQSNQRLWQLLPLGPAGYGESPYSAFSAFAGNSLFIDLDILQENHLLTAEDLQNTPYFEAYKVEYQKVKDFKFPLLNKAAQQFITNNNFSEFDKFQKENEFWLDDFAFFTALKTKFGEKPLFEFEKKIIMKEATALKGLRAELENEILTIKVIQFLFALQWADVKKYANENKVEIIGDIPLYVASDSADVWANPELFLLDKNRQQKLAAGVPPDYFSKTGQLWGNPVYNWEAMKDNNFAWWEARMRINFKMFDIVRIDHFRGLAEFWAVDAKAETAENGQWLPAHGYKMLETLTQNMGKMRLIAEDLGVITPDVEKLRDDFDLPGMKIFQFAFDSDAKNPFLPHNYVKNSIVYTGTHDNDTSRGWFETAEGWQRENLHSYFFADEANIARSMMRKIWASSANTAIVPMQDIFNFGSETRMNTPGTTENNWEWRCELHLLSEESAQFLVNISEIYGRNFKK